MVNINFKAIESLGAFKFSIAKPDFPLWLSKIVLAEVEGCGGGGCCLVIYT